MPRQHKILSFLICEDVRREENTKKEILLGVYNNVIIVPKLPATIAALVFRISVKVMQKGQKQLKFYVVSPSGTKFAVAEASVEINNPEDPSIFVFRGSPVTLGLAGIYKVMFGMDGRPSKVGEFSVREGRYQPNKWAIDNT